MVMQVSIAKQLKGILGIEDSTKIGFLVHVSISICQWLWLLPVWHM